ERLGGLGVVYDRPDLAAEEFAQRLVGLGIRAEVDERIGIGEEVAGGIARLVGGEALLGGHLEGADEALLHRHAGTGPARRLTVRRRIALECGLLPGRHRPVVRRPREVWRALEDRQLRRLLGDERNRLDARRSRADDGDALAGEIDPGVRPATGEVHLAREAIDARDVGSLRVREAAG